MKKVTTILAIFLFFCSGCFDWGLPECEGDTNCDETIVPGSDPDLGVPDLGPADTGIPDSSLVDSSAPDSGLVDSSAPDSGLVDSSAPDSGLVDSSVPDSGPTDAAGVVVPGNPVFSRGSPLLVGDPIILVFAESISDVITEGAFTADVSDIAFTQTEKPSDTITLSTVGGWTSGLGQETTVSGIRTDNGPALFMFLQYDVLTNATTFFFVNGAVADDSGSGLSPIEAKKTIGSAIAAATGPAAILVAGGEYNVVGNVDHIILKDNVSLYGGYAADFTTRNHSLYPTTIRDISSSDMPHRAVEVPAGVSRTTIIDGFTILGGTGFSAGIFVGGGSATIRNNVIIGGSGPGVLVDPGSPSFEANIIQGGVTTAANTFSNGALLANCESQTRLINNLIVGNQSVHGSTGLTTLCSPTAQHNIIVGGRGQNLSTAVFIGINGQPRIENNILFSSESAVRQCVVNQGSNNITAIRNNTMFGCASALYSEILTGAQGNCPFDTTSYCITSIAEFNNLPFASGNINDTVNFIDIDGQDNVFETMLDNVWLFEPDTNTCAVLDGGLDLTSEIPRDREGRPRFGDLQFSMGAYEAHGPCL